MAIAAPEKSPKRELARKMFDTLLAGVPLVGGPLAALYSVTHPAKGEVDQEKWQKEVTDLLNSFEEAIGFLTKSISLSEDAAIIGKWMSEQSKDGWSDLFEYDKILKQFPEASQIEILEAVGELELEGMITVSKVLGKPFSHARATHKLFEVFDPIVFDDASPRADAALIADMLLASDKGISAAQISEETSWSVRRLNPVLAIVGEFIAPGRKSQPMGQPFIIRSMFVDGAERARLRRFVNEVNGE